MPMWCVVAIQKILDFVGDSDEEDMYVLALEGLLLHVDNVRRKLPLPREPAGAITKEGTNLYWVAKLQGAVERQYSFYADSCLVKIHVILQ
jgi:hypothetical protein